jgi:hypothetical protein
MLKNKLEQNIVDDLPYHLASSSLAGVTTAFFGGGAGFFLEKRATVLKVEEVEEEEGTVLVAPLNLIGLPSISDIPSEAAAVEAAMEAMIMENLLQLKKNLDECVAEFTMKELEIEVVTI